MERAVNNIMIEISIKGLPPRKMEKYCYLFKYLIENDFLEVKTGQTIIHWADGYFRKADKLESGDPVISRRRLKYYRELAIMAKHKKSKDAKTTLADGLCGRANN